MSRTAEEIVALWRQRERAAGPLVMRMNEIRLAYNGDLALPLPQMDKTEKAAVANLIAQGVDQTAQRIASVIPDVACPPMTPGQALAEKNARNRRAAVLAWWDTSELEIMASRRARHLLAYTCTPVVIRPDRELGMPRWHIRNPLATFPSASDNPDNMCPDDCVFAYQQSLGYLKARYPAHMMALEKGDASDETMFDMVEYVDGDIHSLIVVGREPVANDRWNPRPTQVGDPLVEVERFANRIGRCTAIVPGRITLDRPVGKYDGMVGMYQAQAKLMALELIAVEKGVFPKDWLVGRPGEVPEVVIEADGRKGITGVVKGGGLESPSNQPSYMTSQTIQQLEENQRQQGGIPMEWSGQSPTNVRTGKRGSDIMSALVDFPVQEAQTILARSREHENSIAIAMAVEYGLKPSKPVFVKRGKGARGWLDYDDPKKLFVTDITEVSYPHAGSDANQLTVLLGQLVGLGLVSEATARRLHPLVDDPDAEAERTISEALNKALLAAISAQVQQGSLAAPDVAFIMNFLDTEKGNLAKAVMAVHVAQQERQAAQPQPGAPESQPGLAPGPGGVGGAGATPPSVNPASPSEANLANLLSTLHAPPQQTAAA